MKAVIFDMDGVLINSEPIHVDIEMRFLKELGIDITRQEMTKFIGTSASDMWKILIDEYKIGHTPEWLVKELNVIKTRFFKENDLHPIEGIKDLLDVLKSKEVKMAVASSSPMEHIEVIVDSLGIRDYFYSFVSGESFEESKPNPAIFLATADRLGVEPEECLVIEDSTHGIAAAKSAGMACVGYDNPSSEHQVYEEADLVVDAISKVMNQLDRF